MSQSNNHSHLFKSLCFTVLALLSLSGFAASLGRMTVHSALGEAFRAEVELLNVSSDEANSLVARMASPETFRRQGVEMNATVLGIKAILVNDGIRPLIQLRSNEGLQEPLIDLLVEIGTDKGSFVKKYTLLLDPPLSKPSSSDNTSPALVTNNAPTNGGAALILKPSFNLNTQPLRVAKNNPSQSLSGQAPTQLSKRALRALEKAELKAERRVKRKASKNKDTLTVYAPSNPADASGQETPQALARRLVKSGVNDPAQIEALIIALNAVKATSELAKPTGAAASNAATSEPATGDAKANAVASVISLPQFKPAPASTVAPAPAAQTVALPSPSKVIEPPADQWLSLLDTYGLPLALLALLGALIAAWFYQKRRVAVDEPQSLEDYKPMASKLESPSKPSEQTTQLMADTKFFESRFLTEIYPQSNVAEATLVEPIDHAKVMITQGDSVNARSILKNLLLNNPDDHSARLMLISLCIDKEDDAVLDEQIEYLRKATAEKGEIWQVANKQYISYKANQQTSLEFTKTEIKPELKTESPGADTPEINAPSLEVADRSRSSSVPKLQSDLTAQPAALIKQDNSDLQFLSLDLTSPTTFAPPSQSAGMTMSSIDFDAPDLNAALGKKPTPKSSKKSPT